MAIAAEKKSENFAGESRWYGEWQITPVKKPGGSRQMVDISFEMNRKPGFTLATRWHRYRNQRTENML